MKKIIMLCLSIFIFLPFSVQARRGCCSHHGGVAGCSSSGRQICSDGTLSPSCTCTSSYRYGCTDKSAKNYSSTANKDDGSCEYQKNVDMEIEKEKSYDFNSKNQKEENNVQDNPLLGFGILGAFSYLLFKKKRS